MVTPPRQRLDNWIARLLHFPASESARKKGEKKEHTRECVSLLHFGDRSMDAVSLEMQFYYVGSLNEELYQQVCMHCPSIASSFRCM